jgi:HAD superfamily hydrolase (TIGR01490 family)
MVSLPSPHATRDPSPPVAFFDLDRTLLAHNSGVLYARSAHAQGRISALDLVRSVGWGIMHWLNRLDVDETYRRAGALFRGMSDVEVRAEVHAWFEREANQHLRPGGREALRFHRERGELTVLITNSSSHIAEAATHFWGLDAYLANDILTDTEGRITGEVRRPLCYGQGKVIRAEAWAQRARVSLERAWFYSDSISDLPLLERVGTPVAVHPDLQLRRVAKRRSWQVADWSR